LLVTSVIFCYGSFPLAELSGLRWGKRGDIAEVENMVWMKNSHDTAKTWWFAPVI